MDFRFDVRLDRGAADQLADALHWQLAGLRSSPQDGRGPSHLYRLTLLTDEEGQPSMASIERDGESVRARVPVSRALVVLMADINLQAIASRPDQLGVHAGAVSLNGTGILLPGTSGSGKSTLTGGLLRAGCDYLTDEAVFIDHETFEMQPYAKPLSLSLESQSALRCAASEFGPVDLLPPSALRSGALGRPIPPRLLVFPSFEAGSATKLTPLSRGEALVKLANNSFNFVDHGGAWLPLLRDVVAGCRCFRLSTGDVREAVQAVMQAAGD